MNNSPGWASPGSTPSSDEPGRGTQEQPTQDDRTGSTEQPSPPNWSKEQPPAGQWSAPAGIPGQSGPRGRSGPSASGDRTRAASSGTGGPGWGGPSHPGNQPPWGGAWAPVPQAAKPGVIPLRPLALGEILDGAVATMRAHWRTVLGISLIVAVVSQTAITVVTGLFQNARRVAGPASDSATPLRENMRQLGNALAGTGITSAIGLLATIIATGMLTMVVSRAVLGRSVTAGEAWRDARTQLPRLLGLLVLLPLLITAILTAGVAPGLILAATGPLGTGLLLTLFGGLATGAVSLWLGVRFSLAAPALMLEKQGVIAAMRRSAKLVRGAWWRVLGAQLLAYVLVSVVEFIIQIPATIIAFLIGGENLMDWANGTSNTSWSFLIVVGIGAVISSAITFPVSAGVTALLYMDQRIRREALDLELARAAGLPGYGSYAPAAYPSAPNPPAPTADEAPADPAATTSDAPAGTATAQTPATADSPATASVKAEGSRTESTESTDASVTGADPAPTDTTPSDTTSTDATAPPADGPGQRPDDTAPGS
ncbi:hypothetical protein [Streptomyces sp. ISID311]|uniref:DUF7544 domain-containing protein n=1 Tax=Streptomyces sp. ISID311 TaxID=2601673 RepID=UPI0011BD32E2|nr:hypothetical protein [Streptomyces sp. ISID311]TXC90389.1 hypothetical protein FS847_34755 [Streptomyces sp. ISID311]